MNFGTTLTWIEVILMVFLIGLMVFWDFRFQPSRGRILRLSFSITMVGAVIFMYLKPTIQLEAPQKIGAIFTAPISPDQKDSILQNSNLLEIPTAIDPGDLPYSISEIQVHGDGLESWRLERIEGFEITWHPSALEEGITSLQVPEILEGSPFEITGSIYMRQDLTLSLIGPEGKSIDQKLSKGNSAFQFTSEVKAAGLFLYELLGVRGEDTIFSETFPVEVLPSRQANVLLLGSFPSFEWNYLKNHLGDLGFGVASKFQLSRDVAHTEFLNIPELNLNVINKTLLQSFKLVIMDGDAFDRLSNRQRNVLYRAVELAEVGLFLMIDDLSDLASIASINAIDGNGEVVVSTAEKQISLLKMPFSIRDQNWKRIMYQSQEIGAYQTKGIGKIGFSMIGNSHVLELQGTSEFYGQLWDRLLSPVVGFDLTSDQFYGPLFSFQDRQIDISFSYFGQPHISIDGQPVSPINSPVRPDLWSVSYWPKRQGWHEIQLDGEDKWYFFVHNPKEWLTLQRFEKQRYNQYYFATNEVVDSKKRQMEEPVSRWLPFAVFLIAMVGLWLERKLS